MRLKQREIMKFGEADAWYKRNLQRLGRADPVSVMIARNKITPKSVLEVGCADGWRLAKLRDRYGCEVLGIDPSPDAGRAALQTYGIPVHRSSARNLLTGPGEHDMIIFGFCLYVTDPEEWFAIAAEADYALADNGYLVIHDFAEPTGNPFTRPYEHHRDLVSHHFDFAKLWLSHPFYVLTARALTGPDDMVTILRKVTSTAFEARS